jgi:hypothetical protein
MPWQGLATNPSGGFRPCCWMDSHLDVFRGPLSEYTNSDYLKKIKESFLKGEYPSECKKCKWNDEKNITSKRIIENKKWEKLGNQWKDYDTDQLSIVDLRFSNICNLGCVMCGPRYSSYLHQEILEHKENIPDYWSYKSIKHKEKAISKPYTSKDTDQILSRLSNNAQIYFAGGEPSLDKDVMRFLEILVETGYNKTVLLQFNSNFQALNHKWISMLKNFNGWMYASVDGVGKVAEFIRYPCNWAGVEKNIRHFIEECGETWSVSIMPTVSILTIFDLVDLFEWESQLKSMYGKRTSIRVGLANRLFLPVQFDICNLPDEAKQIAIKMMQDISGRYHSANEMGYADDIIKHLQQPPKCSFKSATDALDKIDEMRNTNWRSILTQLGRFS